MDEKGYIFTADATLALVVIIVLMATVVSYTMLPMYMGQDHQHLEALADSALQTMEQDGSLQYASVLAVNNSTNATAQSQEFLSGTIQSLIPAGIGYKLTINPGTAISVESPASATDSYRTDVATRVRVISGPAEGWWGRAWYKAEPVEFANQEINLTTTVWNFHNWLTNFSPWNSIGLRDKYWGGGNSYQAINFAIPNNTAIRGATYLQGGSASSGGQSFKTNTVINSNPALFANSNQFTFLNLRPGTNTRMYNYQGNIPISSLHTLVNNFYVQFVPADFSWNSYDMPWFSILANYTTNITVPVNVNTTPYYFQDTAGLAVPNQVDLGGGMGYGRIYNLATGQVTNLNNRSVISWDNMRAYDSPHGGSIDWSNGIPFVITGVPGVSNTGHGSAVSVVQDINIPSNTNLLDAYVVLNSWGAVDGALIEVWNSQSNTWKTVFCSFDVREPPVTGPYIDYSDRADGYGNLPGIVYIGKDLMVGENNKVRITVFDDVPSSDYDLVGIEDSYVMVSTSPYKVTWDTYPFRSHQANDNTETQTQSFSLRTESQKAMLFAGAGLNTRNFLVEYADTGQDLYSGPVPFALDLAELDAQKGYHKITTANSTATNYTLKAGIYALRVTATGPTNAWESGDWNGNAALFSGTRIAVITPQIQNEWSDAPGSNPEWAMANAVFNLNETYKRSHNNQSIPQDFEIHTSALFAGNLPNSVTVRLELWKQ